MFARRYSINVSLLAFLLSTLAPLAFSAPSSNPANKIVNSVNESDLVQLTGNTHRLALPKYDQGLVSDSLPMEHMYVMLRRSPEQEKALQQLAADLQNPHSASYHKWLTADELGAKYGPAQADVDSVVSWLKSHGLQVNLVHKSRMTIDVSGTAAQVGDAFHTEIHKYSVKGEQHIANATDPKIPSALAPVVAGVVSLNDFLPKPLLKKPVAGFSFKCSGCPDGFDNTEQFDEGPGDFATIYNVAPLYTASTPITGKGQTVAVLEVTDIRGADWNVFRQIFGLTSYAGTFRQIHPGTGCTDPGKNGAEGEAALDAEWAGAIAPDADVELASCNNTATNFGAFIAAQNLLDTKTPPQVMSLSYLGCEADQGPGPNGNGFISALWQQAAVEGVSVFVAAGDGAAAGCDDFDTAPYAVGGIAVNGLASTPYNFATGGTDFADTADGTNSTYWNTSNTANGTSALSYIPEIPWDDSCASNVLYTLFGFSSGVSFCNSATGGGFLDIVGGSGGPSFVYSKPSWQAPVFGVPADGKRDLPDASLFASNGFYSHAIILCMSDPDEGGAPCNFKDPTDLIFNSAGGTSFTAPQFASIQALINQKAGGPQGNPAPIYYQLGAAEYGSPTHANSVSLAQCNSNKGNKVGKSCIFHDVTSGNNDVPCYGTANCYLPNGEQFGVLSVSDTSLQVAYSTRTGWDFVTGLGTPNVANLVNNWP
ncbi:MAG: S53 family peptidase [Candidatus Sulfotelmatobacter sp.]